LNAFVKSVTQKMAAAVFDFAALSKITFEIQDTYDCSTCRQKYNKKWCKTDNTTCFFCTKFLPVRDTRQSILKDIDWWYLKSGESVRRTYYNEFIDNLNRWCEVFGIPKTRDDALLEEDLRKVREWSRDYWH
jgi:hypothetical protein